MHEILIGKRVQIHALKWDDGVRILDGLAGVVIAIHPIASEWVKIRLDPNSITPDLEWSIRADRLSFCGADSVDVEDPQLKAIDLCPQASRSALDALLYRASPGHYIS
jgi:hypothetical protein